MGYAGPHHWHNWHRFPTRNCRHLVMESRGTLRLGRAFDFQYKNGLASWAFLHLSLLNVQTVWRNKKSSFVCWPMSLPACWTLLVSETGELRRCLSHLAWFHHYQGGNFRTICPIGFYQHLKIGDRFEAFGTAPVAVGVRPWSFHSKTAATKQRIQNPYGLGCLNCV